MTVKKRKSFDWKPGCALAFLLALAVFASAQVPATAASPFVKASDPRIEVEGRFADAPDGGVRLGFPGVTLHLRYHGDSLTMRLKSNSNAAMFDIVVDGGRPLALRTRSGVHDYRILETTNRTDHIVEITRRTESWQGVCDVISFDLGPGGSLLSPPALPVHKLLFIGDSIVCGAMADYDANTPKSDRTEYNSQWCNADASFGKILARELDAQCELVSYGGRGLMRDWRGLTNVCNAPQFYKLALPDDPKSFWDPSRYVPDAVGICLGQNDFNSGIPDEKIFVDDYVSFVREIRHDAPRAWIFLLDSPMMPNANGRLSKRSILHRYLEETVAALHDPKVALAPVSHCRGNPVDGHPTSADHQAIAAELEPLFRAALDDTKP